MNNDLYYLTVEPNNDITGLRKLLSALKSLKSGRWVVSIQKQKRKRTLPQNRFYFGNFIEGQIECFKERFGETYSKEQIHEFNKSKFWATEQVIEATGEIIKIPTSSTSYTTVQWEEKLEEIRQYFRLNLDWELPYPQQQTEIGL